MADYPTSEEIARLKEARELRREQIRDLTKVKDKTAEQEALLAKLKTEHIDIGKQLREQLEIRKELNADLREEILALEGLANQYNAIQGSIDARIAAISTESTLIQKQIDLITVEQEKTGIITDNDIARTKELKKQLKILQRRLTLAENAAAASENTADAIAGILGISQDLNLTWGENLILGMKQGDILSQFNEKYVKTGRLAASISEKAGEAFLAYTAMIVHNTLAVDEAQSAVNIATGAQGKYNMVIQDTTNSLRAMGVQAGEVGSTVTALHSTFTDFTMMNETTAQDLVRTGAMLAELGVKNEDFAAGLQVSQKMLGMGQKQAEFFTRELAAYANELEVSPGMLAAAYGSLGPELSKLDDAAGSFKELARVSKITGMEMQKILNLTNKFDTFEGAAETVGRLNALMGGDFVNSMDLMMATDPAERFGMIRDALSNAGLAFDDMTYYQKLAYKEALGLESVGDLALLMSGNFDSLSGATDKSAADFERLAAEAAKNQEFMDLLKSTLAALAPAFTEIIKALKPTIIAFSEWIQSLDPGTIKMMAAGIAIGLGAIAAAFTLMSLAITLSTIKIGLAAPAIAGMAGSVAALAAAAPAAAAGQAGLTAANTAAAPAAAAAAPAMATLGASLLKLAFGLFMVGASVYLAATGIGNLAEGFSGLNVAQMIGVSIAMALVAGGIWLLVASSAAAGAAAGPLAAFGGALIVIGAAIAIVIASIGIAAWGIGKMAEGFAALFEAADPATFAGFTASLAIFAAVINAIGMSSPIAGTGLAVIAGGLLAIGIAMMMMEDSLVAMDGFISGLVTLTTRADGLGKVAKSIKSIGQSISALPEGTAIELTTAMRATTAAAAAGARTAATPNAAMAGPRRGKQAVNVNLKLENNDLIKFLKGEFVTYEQMMEAIEGL
jgi:hypothetical protein